MKLKANMKKIERWENEAIAELRRVSNRCLKCAQDIEWKHEFPELETKIEGSAVDVIADLIMQDMGVLYKKLEKVGKYGLLPLMASCLKGQIGALNAESFAKRINVTSFAQPKLADWI